ncbi:bifunctional 2-polyprenyl-6-hydroxyphenol methylase/3-demethylubiquinol 3-O-methyltransferase UbiG [Shewanella sp. 6_MG-2023]|uniref:class I SAM-dependent methyltransferase n=1 Tax=Shewanella sp. 6_MG-2023 TaxID=3062660 RepID=UPI0026E32500|nr:class I SAM-dependent methyltransferase [Shewanella sp. 6_MG-2023]MDO6620398.1 class I SAM-dependent methyltransferase [Shewanella sp. 6_MG-2023]
MTQFYNQNSNHYFNSTVDADMSSVQEKFLAYIPKYGSILDAGCGSGRDTKSFIDMGFKVTAFDASKSLCLLAENHTNIKVIHSTFIDFVSTTKFDGIWACASLLHVPRHDLLKTIEHLGRLLIPNGHLYCSFKFGEEDTENDGRLFNNQTTDTFPSYIPNSFKVIEIWISEDNTKLNRQQQWLNVILKESA